MLNFLAWYFLISLIGWTAFPLAFHLFPRLADRGFTFMRALGLLLWGYLFWILASLGVIQNDGGGLGLAFFLLLLTAVVVLWPREGRQAFADWLRSNGRTILTAEILFLLAFALMALVRASNPQIETAGGEKTMETAFINAILRSPTFPPQDPWLSGYAISYYYFGYVMAAMLAKATATLGTVAHNLMTALIFGLSFIGAYGIVYNLLAAWQEHHAETEPPEKPRRVSIYGLPVLGPVFLLFVSNLVGFLTILHNKGIFWSSAGTNPRTSAFWTWLGITDLTNPPGPYFNWWWRASRVIQDLDLHRIPQEIIDEFPAFSYLLGDLHPHVLAMPFDLLAVAVGLNLFLGGWKGETNLYFFKLPIRPLGLFFSAVLLGGLVFLNTWDILLGFALVAGAFGLSRVLAEGWSWRRVEDLIAFSIPAGVMAFLLYLPFFFGFSSQAGGILPSVIWPTRGAYLWVMLGPFFVVLFPFILFLWRTERVRGRWARGFGLAAGFALLLWLVSWGLAFIAFKAQPGAVQELIDSQCNGSIAICFKLATLKRISYMGGLLTLLGLIGPAVAYILPAGDREEMTERAVGRPVNPLPFVMFMVLVGAVLVLAPDFVFLRDLFSYRLNTIFKFYFQAWILLSLGAAFGAGVLLQKFRGSLSWVYWPIFAAVLAAALVFPIKGVMDKANSLQIPAFRSTLKSEQAAEIPTALEDAFKVWTLDGGRLFQAQYPDDAAAARWLLTAPAGVVAEAASPDAYSDFGRMAVYSGQPSVLGWTWHEFQWRGSTQDQVSPIQDLPCLDNNFHRGTDARRFRYDDLACLYQTNDWKVAQEVMATYHIRYVVVGILEHRVYRVNETKFKTYMQQVFRSNDVVIYETP